jgi:arginyl-tRNA synthetase
MDNVSAVLTDLVRQAASAAGHAESPVPLEPCVATNDPRHGDYQSNFAFRLGKALRTNPRAMAQQIADVMPAHPAVAGTEIAGPGFINFRLNNDWLGERVVAAATADHFGTPPLGAGRTVVIDYSSPNVAKRMHVGHLRSTIIGNAIHRMYAALGWTVVADNHIGDWGTQFGKLIVGLREWADECPIDDDPIGRLQWLYQQFDVKAVDAPDLIDRAREETAKLQRGDEENVALWRHIVDVSKAENDLVYERLGVRFDVTHGESFYSPMLPALLEELVSKGLAVESDGALIIEFEASDGKGLAKNPLLVRKSDGAALYGTTDLATIQHRLDTWWPERIVYVTDVRQKLHFRQVFAGSRKRGVANVDLEHVGFGLLKFAGGAVASTREGTVINLVDLLDTAAAKAFDVVSEKNPDLSEQERRAIAESVGLGAVRYTDLSQNPQSDITFDWDRMLSFEGNTAPYLIYAYARCCSILRKAGDFSPGKVTLDHPLEQALARTLVRLPEVIPVAANTYRPNLLCDHLFQIAQAFSRFFRECHVLKAETPELRESRLTLVWASSRAMRVGLELLGIDALERM